MIIVFFELKNLQFTHFDAKSAQHLLLIISSFI